jgi:glycosyltransferase involved in cell wall biosynthesis
MNPAPVSVVIPSHNHADFLPEAIASVLAQTRVPSEIIVIDDGSTDGTRECLLPYMDRVRYVYQENQGVSAARNRGLGMASNELVAFLDSDDVWHPDKIRRQTELLAKHPDIGLLSSTAFDWPCSSFPWLGPTPDPLIVPWEDLVVRNYFMTSSIMVRRAVLERAGFFDTALQGPEDRDLWIRIAEVSLTARIDLPLLGSRVVEGSLSRQASNMQRYTLKILRKLDQRNAWQGRWLLRRKAYSYCYHSCSHMYSDLRQYGSAAFNVLKSLAWYPLPYWRREVRVRFERPKRLAVSLMRLFRLKGAAPIPPSRLPEGVGNALHLMRMQPVGSAIS